MIFLGLESSCDETAAALVDDQKGILAQRIFSQFDAHRAFGGVVPEIAARHHLEILPNQIQEIFKETKLEIDDIDGIAATAGPGLLGGLIIASLIAKSMALAANKPYIAINHLEAHALTARLIATIQDKADFPFCLLLVSGGHCQIVLVKGVGEYNLLATSLDDAVGEAFDKTAKILGLGYPGGPAVQAMAKQARNGNRFKLPRPMVGKKNLSIGEIASGNFSFSGLKAAVRRQVEAFPTDENGHYFPNDCADMAAAFEDAVVDIMIDRLNFAMDISLKTLNPPIAPLKRLVVAGGVGANLRLRAALLDFCNLRGLAFTAPPAELCADNAAMIAWAGIERFRISPKADSYDFKARPRWPLAELTTPNQAEMI